MIFFFPSRGGILVRSHADDRYSVLPSGDACDPADAITDIENMNYMDGSRTD